eukprot:3848349-Pleurochrysis_carterae.AAC.1
MAPRTPRLWEGDELVTRERKIKTKPIAFHRTLAEIGIAEWADIYDKTTKEHYTMGDLCKKYGVRKNTRIMQEYSNVKRLHNKQLQEAEHGALGIIWGRHKEELLEAQGEKEYKKWGDGEQKWVNKVELENMSGAEAELIHRARELIMEGPVTFAEHMIDYGVVEGQQTWSFTCKEFLKYAQRGHRGRSARENAKIGEQKKETSTRESHPTLYPGEVLVGENEGGREPGRQRRNMRRLTDRAKANQHRQERKEETHKNKRIRLANGENGTRRVSEQPKQRPGGGEWELPPLKADIAAWRLLGGRDGRGTHRVFKEEAMDLAHEEKYAGHPILRLFTRPEEMENGIYMR